jgi:serine phosphatase RsbU (regulator of sigma subunit)
MFGRERFMDIVRGNHRSSAAGLRDVILGEVTDFRGSNLQEDDVTLVVFKFT